MILKYYTWNKITKCWDDGKVYCSICASKASNKLQLTAYIYDLLTKRNLISIPQQSLSLIDRSHAYTASYHLFAAVGGKNINFGKLEEIPNKHSGFKKAKESYFADTTITFASIQVPRPHPQPITYQFIIDEMPVIQRNIQAAPVIPAAPLADVEEIEWLPPIRGRRYAADVQRNDDFGNLFIED